MATGDSKTCTWWMNGSHPQNFSRPNSRPFSFRPKKNVPGLFHGTLVQFCMFLQSFFMGPAVFHGTCLCCSSCCLFVGHFEFNSLPPLAFLEIKFDFFSQEGGSKNSIHIQPLRKSAKINWMSGLMIFDILARKLGVCDNFANLACTLSGSNPFVLEGILVS